MLLAIIAAQLLSTEEQIPGWLVENVAYHNSYNEERVLTSTNYGYELVSQRDGEDFFINHTAPENLGGFELVGWKNCEVLERNQLENRTIELHFRLHEGAAGSRTHFSYQLKPTDPRISPDNLSQMVEIDEEANLTLREFTFWSPASLAAQKGAV